MSKLQKETRFNQWGSWKATSGWAISTLEFGFLDTRWTVVPSVHFRSDRSLRPGLVSYVLLPSAYIYLSRSMLVRFLYICGPNVVAFFQQTVCQQSAYFGAWNCSSDYSVNFNINLIIMLHFLKKNYWNSIPIMRTHIANLKEKNIERPM